MSNESDSPSLQASVNPGTARLGDLITLSVQATHPPGVLVEPLSFQKALGTFEVFASTAFPAEPNGALQVQRFEIQLQNFTTGQQVLPGIGFIYRGPDNQPHILKTQELKVLIEVVPPGSKDKGDIRGIKGTIGPAAISPWWWLLLAFAMIVGAICWWKETHKKVQGPPPEPPIPADQLALEKLNELLASGWIESGQIKEFYIGISDVVRAYIEVGFKCPALERTTGELMRDLRRLTVFNSVQTLQIKQLLEDCDLVKFAKFRPDEGESLKAHAMAVRFIEDTKGALKTSEEKDE